MIRALYSAASGMSAQEMNIDNIAHNLANIEHQVPNTPRTKLSIGSITKQFTAMAIMILAEQGKLKLDDPIGKYIDDAPATWEKVAIHHLLTHTSGISNYTSDPRFDEMMTRPERVKTLTCCSFLKL